MGFSVDSASDSNSSKVGEEGEAVKFDPACCDSMVSSDAYDGGASPEAAAPGLSRETTCRWIRMA